MMYVLDPSILVEIARGDRTAIELFGWHRKSDVAAPEPVILHVEQKVRAKSHRGWTKRWQLLVAELPRIPWTPAVTEHLLALRPSDPLVAEAFLDVTTIAAAHALASDAALLTLAPERVGWIAGLRVERLY